MFALLLLASLCSATKYFFDPARGSDNSKSGLSSSDAFGTLCSWKDADFSSKFVDDDVLVLLPGDHKCSNWRLSKVFRKITIEGQRGPSGEWAVVDTMYHRGASGLLIRGIHLTGQVRCDRAVSGSGCDNIVIERCLVGLPDSVIATMNKTQLSGISSTTLMTAGNYGAVRECYIRYQRRGSIVGDYTTFESNVVEFCVGDQIRVSGSHVIVRNNVLRGALAVDDDHRDMLQVYAGRINVQNLSITQNWFSSEHPGLSRYPAPVQQLAGDTQGVSAFDDTLENLVLENNCILVNHHHGSTWGAINGTQSRIRFNTLMNAVSPTAPSYIGKCWLRFGNMSGPVVNNVGTIVPLPLNSIVTFDNSTSVFVKLSGNDVRLKAGSVLRNVAGAVPSGLVDVTGAPRTTNDAGCLSAATSDKTGKWWGSLPIDPLSTGPVDYPPPLDGAPVFSSTTMSTTTSASASATPAPVDSSSASGSNATPAPGDSTTTSTSAASSTVPDDSETVTMSSGARVAASIGAITLAWALTQLFE